MVVALLGVLQFIHVVREAVDGGEDFHERHNAVVGEQFSFGPPGEGVDHVGASGEDHIHPEVFQ